VEKLTVFFENPFWVGVCERENDGKYEVCKVTFGAGPKDCQVYEYFLNNWHSLNFSPAVAAEVNKELKPNPKRMQREIKKQIQNTGVGTKAQQALALQREQNKITRKTRSKEERELEEERKFKLRQEKRKEKHKGH